jgi:hypothetical protein
MATHTRYPDIKKWAESRERRSIQLWMPKETIGALDRLCRERGLRRAERLDSLIREVDARNLSGEAADGAERLQA